MARVRVTADIKTVVRVYYENPELGTAEIKMLFGNIAGSTIAKLKNAVLKEMSANNILQFGYACVNTELAYKVWNIDIEDYERRMAKLNKLKLAE